MFSLRFSLLILFLFIGFFLKILFTFIFIVINVWQAFYTSLLFFYDYIRIHGGLCTIVGWLKHYYKEHMLKMPHQIEQLNMN